jgi:hypothetical protein
MATEVDFVKDIKYTGQVLKPNELLEEINLDFADPNARAV